MPLVIPAKQDVWARGKIQEMGLRRDNWFCAMHWREPTYKYKAIKNYRDGDPTAFLRAVDYVIDELGGQVVQLGHPEMARRTPRQGYIDLSSLQDSWILQAAATRYARYFAGSASGATGMAHAFCIPSAHIDVLDWYTPLLGDCAVTPRVRIDGGPILRQQALFSSGMMSSHALTLAARQGREIEIVPSNTWEIVQAISQVHVATSEIQGWRKAIDDPVLSPTNGLTIPLPVYAEPLFVELKEEA